MSGTHDPLNYRIPGTVIPSRLRRVAAGVLVACSVVAAGLAFILFWFGVPIALSGVDAPGLGLVFLMLGVSFAGVFVLNWMGSIKVRKGHAWWEVALLTLNGFLTCFFALVLGWQIFVVVTFGEFEPLFVAVGAVPFMANSASAITLFMLRRERMRA